MSLFTKTHTEKKMTQSNHSPTILNRESCIPADYYHHVFLFSSEASFCLQSDDYQDACTKPAEIYSA